MSEIKRGRGPYFAPVPWELQDQPGVTAFDLATYAALKRFADFGSEEGAEVSDRVVALKAGCSEAAVRRSRVRLRDWGWISWKTRPVAKGRINVYSIHASRQDRIGSALPEQIPLEGVRSTGTDGSDPMERTGPLPQSDNREPSTESHNREGTSSPAKPGGLTQGEVHSKGDDWNGGVILKAWIDRFPDQGRGLSEAQRKKYGAVCKKLAEGHPREYVVQAFVGMDHLFPHSKGEPWDPITLSNKLALAFEAAKNHPTVKRRAEERSLLQHLQQARAGT